jgi:hypothetical protein
MDPLSLITGEFLSGGEDRKAKGYMEDAAKAFENIELPKLSPLQLEQYAWLQNLMPSTISGVGDVSFDPVQAAQAQLALAGPSAMEGVSTDPRLKEHQLASLSALDELAAGGGMTAADKANLNRVQTDVAQADRGRREAILQNMAARGMGGSGNELLAQLQSSQAATDRANQTGLDISGMAQQRALDAMLGGGQLAGSIRGQDFGEQAQIAAAQDAISKFNAANTNQSNQFNAGQTNNMGQFNASGKFDAATFNANKDLSTQQFNAGQTQSANQFNVAGAQGVADGNVGIKNDQTMHNQYQIPQQNFGNAITKAGGQQHGAEIGMNYYGQKAAGKQDAWKNLLSGGMMIGAAYAGKDSTPKKAG